MNDHHSHFDEVPFDIRDPAHIPSEELIGVSTSHVRMHYGGFPLTVAYLKEAEAAAAATGQDLLKIHAGDAMTGTFYYSFFGPRVDATAMNMIEFDVFVTLDKFDVQHL